MTEEAIALKALIRQRHMSYEAFCREWDRAARTMDDALTGHYPGRAQYYRWLRGQLANKRPYPDACRMLEAMFPGWSVEMLFSPYAGALAAEPPGSAAIADLGVNISPLSQDALQISPTGLTGWPSHAIDLSGEWWASWQTFRDGVEKIATQQVECKQSGEVIQVATIAHGLRIEEGGYHWSGDNVLYPPPARAAYDWAVGWTWVRWSNHDRMGINGENIRRRRSRH
jgi:hypothetical protein